MWSNLHIIGCTHILTGIPLKTKNNQTLFFNISGWILYSFLIVSSTLMSSACSKETSDTGKKDKASLSVRLTDAPAIYDAVLVDIIGVEVTGQGGNTIALGTNAGIYNLLDLANGVDTLIASADIDAGSISQIRLILGDGNSVVINGINYSLSTPSASESGLKLQIHRTFEPGIAYCILIDFDASKSIVAKGNGDYLLKPVIRAVDTAISGSITGITLPVISFTTITTSSSTLSVTTVVNDQGKFVINGLPAGIYDVTVTPNLPTLPITLPGITVSVGYTTDLGVISL